MLSSGREDWEGVKAQMGLVYMGLVGRGEWAVTGLRNHGEILYLKHATYFVWGVGVWVCARRVW